MRKTKKRSSKSKKSQKSQKDRIKSLAGVAAKLSTAVDAYGLQSALERALRDRAAPKFETRQNAAMAGGTEPSFGPSSVKDSADLEPAFAHHYGMSAAT